MERENERAFWLMTLAAFYTFAEAAATVVGLALPKTGVQHPSNTVLSMQNKVRNPCSIERWSRGNGAKWFETSRVVGEKTAVGKKDERRLTGSRLAFISSSSFKEIQSE